MVVNKFNLTVEENIFIAQRNIVEYIYNITKLESLSVTFSQVQIITDGITVAGVTVDDTITVHNLKRAWDFILSPDVLSHPVDYALSTKINNIFITPSFNTSLEPINEYAGFQNILEIESTTERAIATMLYMASVKMFDNRNLMIAMLMANKIMISGGAGIISVPINLTDEFKVKFSEYQRSKDSLEITSFLYDNCIDGIHLNEDRI